MKQGHRFTLIAGSAIASISLLGAAAAAGTVAANSTLAFALAVAAR
jgi:hypothetical protein